VQPAVVLVVVAEELPGATFVEGEEVKGDEAVAEEGLEEVVGVEVVAFPGEGRGEGSAEGSEAVARFCSFFLTALGKRGFKNVLFA
jgi:hypothetical protein